MKTVFQVDRILQQHFCTLNKLLYSHGRISLQFMLFNEKLRIIVVNLSKFSEYKLN